MTTGGWVALGIGAYFLFQRQQTVAAQQQTALASSPSAAAASAINSLVSGLQKALSGAAKASGGSKSGGAGGNPAGGAGSGRSAGGTQAGSVEDSFATFDNIDQPGTLQDQANTIAANTSAASPAPDLSAGITDSPDLSNLFPVGSSQIPALDATTDPVVDPSATDVVPAFDPSSLDLSGLDLSGLDLGSAVDPVGIDSGVGGGFGL